MGSLEEERFVKFGIMGGGGTNFADVGNRLLTVRSGRGWRDGWG
jgi:hypothetical protein